MAKKRLKCWDRSHSRRWDKESRSERNLGKHLVKITGKQETIIIPFDSKVGLATKEAKEYMRKHDRC